MRRVSTLGAGPHPVTATAALSAPALRSRTTSYQPGRGNVLGALSPRRWTLIVLVPSGHQAQPSSGNEVQSPMPESGTLKDVLRAPLRRSMSVRSVPPAVPSSRATRAELVAQRAQ